MIIPVQNSIPPLTCSDAPLVVHLLLYSVSALQVRGDAILLGHAGISVPTSQAGDNAAMAPPEFLRLQYSTDPPLSAENSRESTPELGAEAAQAVPVGMQVWAQQVGNLRRMCIDQNSSTTTSLLKPECAWVC